MPGTLSFRPSFCEARYKLQIAIFLGVRRQFVGADIDLAPLEALADIPDRQQAGAPGREMVVLALRLAQPLAANPVIRDLPWQSVQAKLSWPSLRCDSALPRSNAPLLRRCWYRP